MPQSRVEAVLGDSFRRSSRLAWHLEGQPSNTGVSTRPLQRWLNAPEDLHASALCHASRPKFVLVNGRVVVQYGQVVTLDAPRLVAHMNDIVRRRFR